MDRLLKLDHYSFYLFGLIVLVIGLPWSPFLISLAQAILLANWILEGNISDKLKQLLRRHGALLFISIFLWHFIGLINTSDISMAFKDIKIKLPLFILPLVIATSKPLSVKQLKIVLTVFNLTLFITSIFSILALFGLTGHTISDIRDISLFISHIRFGLLVNIAIFSLAFIIYTANGLHVAFKIVSWILLLWFTAFLFILQSITGIVVFVATLGFLLLKWSLNREKLWIKVAGLSSAFFIPIAVAGYLFYVIQCFYNVEEVNKTAIDQYTQKGNPYDHNFESTQVENGHYVWLYVSYPELEEAWNKRSELKFNEKDHKGHQLKLTLIRYLTSKGYRKDAGGVNLLSAEDIRNIENGIANYIYTNKMGIYPRLYQIVWEFDIYRQGKNPSGHSVTQRFEYYKSAFHIIKENYIVGVGTGDVKAAFDAYYEASDSKLTKRWQLRAHNQYLTFLLTFGIIGFIWIVIAIITSIIKEQGFKNYLFYFFFFIAFLSMISEDTLETQAGATFFAFFYSLFLFGYKTGKQKNLFSQPKNTVQTEQSLHGKSEQ